MATNSAARRVDAIARVPFLLLAFNFYTTLINQFMTQL